MNKIYRKLLRELGLTYPQYLVMLVLWERDGAGRELRQKTGEVQYGVFRASGCTVEELVAIKQQLDLLRSRLMENA
jgi:hypothetical protein